MHAVRLCTSHVGVLYCPMGWLSGLCWQMGTGGAGLLAIGAWTAVLMGVFFGLMWYFGVLRCSKEEELQGLDEAHHGGPAYSLPPAMCCEAPPGGDGDCAAESKEPDRQRVAVGNGGNGNAVVPFDEG